MKKDPQTPMNKRIRLTCSDNVVEEESPASPSQASSKQGPVKKEWEGRVEMEVEEEKRKNLRATAFIEILQNKLAKAEAEKNKLAKELNELKTRLLRLSMQNTNNLKTQLVEWKIKFLKVEAENYKLVEGLASERLELSLERQNTEKVKSQLTTKKDEAVKRFKEEAKMEVLKAEAEKSKLAEELELELLVERPRLELELSIERDNSKRLRIQLNKEKDEAVKKLKEEILEVLKVETEKLAGAGAVFGEEG